MECEQVFEAVADERRSIAALIDDLDSDQLATASLCAGWDVKTVAAHLVSDFADGFWGFMTSRPGARFSHGPNATRLLFAPTPARYRAARRRHRPNMGPRRSDSGTRCGGDVGRMRTYRRVRSPDRLRPQRVAVPACLTAQVSGSERSVSPFRRSFGHRTLPRRSRHRCGSPGPAI